MAKLTNYVIELYDGWQSKQKTSWRKGVILNYRGSDDPTKLGKALDRKMQQVKELMTQDELVKKYWFSHQVGGLLIVLSQNVKSGYKSVPRLQPRLARPDDTRHLFAVYLGPEKGSYAIEGYQLDPMPDSHGVIQQFAPVTWSQEAEKPE